MKRFQLPTIAVISEDFTVRYWLTQQLQTQFYIVEVTQLNMVLEVVKHTELDFIILDSRFEGDEDPLELCYQIRQLNKLVPILFITSRLNKSYRKSAMDIGVTDFLFEQLDEEELKLKIATGLKTASARHKVSDLSERIPAAQELPSLKTPKTTFFLQAQALKFIADARKQGVPLTSLLIRIDRFDQLKKPAILDAFTSFLENNIGPKDLLIPLGSGEFLLLLAKSLQEGEKIGTALLKKVEQHRFETALGVHSVTATLAIFDIGSSKVSFNEMIDVAAKTLKQLHAVTNKILSIPFPPRK